MVTEEQRQNSENETAKLDESVSINEKIRWIAQTIKDRKIFQERAATVAGELGNGDIEILPQFFHNESSPPPELQADFPGFGDWLSARQFAIFEVLYNFREAALPVLRRVAFGTYDWTQANAIEILCRFGIEGIEREQLAEEIAAELPNWRSEAILYAMNGLAKFSPYAPALTEALQNLAEEWGADEPIEALEILEPLVRHAPQTARQQEHLLRQVMRESGIGQRSPLSDGQVVNLEESEEQMVWVAQSGRSHPSILDYHAIRAALMLYQLNPTDNEVITYLREWAEHHPNEQVRREVAETVGMEVKGVTL
jgi:hypothetical protein